MLSRGTYGANNSHTASIQSLQGVYIDRKYKFYVKISLIENKKVLFTRKIYSNNNFKITDFSKEVFFPVGEKNPNDLQILLQLKRYRGFGTKSKSANSHQQRTKFSSSDERISYLVLSSNDNHFRLMVEKPEDRIFMWHDSNCE